MPAVHYSLHLKEEVSQYLQIHYLEELIRKYSQFIDFNVYLWKPKVVLEEMIWDWVWINQYKPIWQRK